MLRRNHIVSSLKLHNFQHRNALAIAPRVDHVQQCS
jgi:hypothetical protein